MSLAAIVFSRPTRPDWACEPSLFDPRVNWGDESRPVHDSGNGQPVILLWDESRPVHDSGNGQPVILLWVFLNDTQHIYSP